MKPVYDRWELAERIEDGETFTFLPFWGHTGDGVGPWVFSQWHPSAFEVDGVRYPTAEHWMMASKARLFGDRDIEAQVVDSVEPRVAKALGRQVAGFDDAVWKAHRIDIVRRGNLARFGAHADLREFLLATGDAVLVEAAPRDQIWGIGLGPNNPLVREPARWRGANLLGFALCWVRDQLRT